MSRSSWIPTCRVPWHDRRGANPDVRPSSSRLSGGCRQGDRLQVALQKSSEKCGPHADGTEDERPKAPHRNSTVMSETKVNKGHRPQRKMAEIRAFAGRPRRSGRGGRRFKSCHSDQKKQILRYLFLPIPHRLLRLFIHRAHSGQARERAACPWQSHGRRRPTCRALLRLQAQLGARGATVSLRKQLDEKLRYPYHATPW